MPTGIEAAEQATAWESVRIEKAENTKTDRRVRKKHIKFIECDPQEYKKNRFWAKYSNSFNIKGPIGKSAENKSKLPVSEPFQQSDTRASGSNNINIGGDECPWGLCETAQSSLLQDPAMINQISLFIMAFYYSITNLIANIIADGRAAAKFHPRQHIQVQVVPGQ